MSIIKFKKETVGASIEVDGTITSITSGVVIKPYLNLGIEIIAPGFEERYLLAGNTFYVNTVVQVAPTQNGLSAQLRDEVFPSTNSGSGGSGGGTSIGGAYDNETDAQAALGAGKLYKSSTLINGSPIILMTIGSNTEVGGSYDTNTEAVAALGAGKLYQSSTLINDSPIILITV